MLNTKLDLRDVFTARNADRLPTTAILDALHAMDEAPWNDFYGKPFDARHLSKELSRYSVHVQAFKVNGTTVKGYQATGETGLEDAWKRYLPPPTGNLQRCVVALRLHRIRQVIAKQTAGEKWREHGLVFPSAVGTELDSHNVRRAFRKVVQAAGLPPADWTPREMRHSFVSLLSDSGVPLEDISRLVGHTGTQVTETVYRKRSRLGVQRERLPIYLMHVM